MSANQGIVLLLIGYFVYTLDKKQAYIPAPVVFLLVGILLSFVPFFQSVMITKNTLYDLFLPALLFVSAYKFSPHALKENAGIIAFLSTLGLIFTALLLGAATFFIGHQFIGLSLIGSLLIASILTPTDPVSVVSILKQTSTKTKVADIVEGESMINDGTSIVLFTVLLSMFIDGESFAFGSFLSDFLFVSIGGASLGILLSWLVSKAVHINQKKEYQVMLSIILAYGNFHLAEYLGVSGILATVSAGIMLAWEFNHTNKTDHLRDSLDGFWDVIETAIFALVFLVIGIKATSYLSWDVWPLACVLFITSLLVRFIIVAGAVQFFERFKREVGWKQSALITWSGIRGTMSVVLILSLETTSSNHASTMISVSFAVVILSLIIQSVGIYPLSLSLESDS